MADERPHLDLTEFRERGYLQEANRLFFHPLGLALEMTVVEPDTGDAGVKRTVFRALKEDCQLGLLIQNEAGGKLPNDEVLRRVEMIAERVAFRLAPPGSERISGVWDYREDAEGIYLGQRPDSSKAARVQEERSAKLSHRAALFGSTDRDSAPWSGDSTVQPLDWDPPSAE